MRSVRRLERRVDAIESALSGMGTFPTPPRAILADPAPTLMDTAADLPPLTPEEAVAPRVAAVSIAKAGKKGKGK